MGANIQHTELNIIQINTTKIRCFDESKPEEYDPAHIEGAESLDFFWNRIPPVKCFGCHRTIMIFTYERTFTLTHNDPEYQNGRTILCGNINPHLVLRERDRPFFPDTEDTDNLGIPNIGVFYYCGDCEQSQKVKSISPDIWIPEVSVSNPFVTTWQKESPQDRIEQLNCSSDCDGQCLIDIFSEYIDCIYYKKIRCHMCNTLLGITTPENPETYMNLARSGIYTQIDSHYVCGDAALRCIKDKCPVCINHFGQLITESTESLQNLEIKISLHKFPTSDKMYRDCEGTYIGNIMEGCVGEGCEGKCLQSIVRNNFPTAKAHQDR